MDSNVTQLVLLSAAPEKRVPQGDVIEVLEKLLHRAKDGEIQGIAFAGTNADRSTFSGWKGGLVVAELMAAVTFLFLRFGAACNKTDLPDHPDTHPPGAA